ncbi:hypothetical protein NliqN6_2673 [Naganishia liquefaciens]|uniref:Bromo domain-containing protein n=1 Tax=Naganishia liquefaciens TaxID=104408 RepID=A0A8H3TSP5_9TREE|nr:hypothetical protein NliqN6_2673 [Naganishia liquefaciens]
MRSPPASSPINEQRKSMGERQMTRRSVKEEPNQGAGQRGKKRGRESEGGPPATPAKRPYRKTGNTQSQDELSPAPPDHSASHSKAGDTDAERDEDVADVPRRVMTRRTSTRGKPPTIEEDSEVDDGESERNFRKRSHKDMEQASAKSALQRRSSRFARSTPDKQQSTHTDETVDDEEEGSDRGLNKVYQPRRGGRHAKNQKEAQADSEGDTVEDERGSEKPERNPKSAKKNQEAKKEAQQLPGANRKESGKNEESNDVEMTTPDAPPRFNGRTRSTRATARPTPTVTSIKAFQTMINPLYEEIVAHKNGPLFLAPVRESDAPGYSKIVKQPMDLKKIKAKIRKGEISTIDEFQRDLWLIFCNAMSYNRPNSEVYRMAQEMMTWCEDKLDDYRNLQHHIRKK